MKCPNCGADIRGKRVCDYCGTPVPLDMIKQQEEHKKQGCPNCKSLNIEYSRENHGEITEGYSKTIVYRTVGFCKDCGTTWYPENQIANPENDGITYVVNEGITGDLGNNGGGSNGEDGQIPKKRRTWLWVLGWIFIFPLPLTIIMLRKKKHLFVKVWVLLFVWAVYLSAMASDDNDEELNSSTSETVVEQNDQSENNQSNNKKSDAVEETQSETHIYDEVEIRDVMNGTRNKKIGEYSICYVDAKECTKKALEDWYFNYVEKNDFNWCMIIYSDKSGKSGVYAIEGIVQKNCLFDIDEYGDYSLKESKKTITYIPDDGILRKLDESNQ